MRAQLKSILVMGLVALSAGACTRRVVVESEPARYDAAAALDVTGAYDFVVELPDMDVLGTMTVTRVGAGYGLRMATNMGDVMDATNIVRDGDTLTFEVDSPAGPASGELNWQSRDAVTGLVFLGGSAMDFRATRQP